MIIKDVFLFFYFILNNKKLFLKMVIKIVLSLNSFLFFSRIFSLEFFFIRCPVSNFSFSSGESLIPCSSSKKFSACLLNSQHVKWLPSEMEEIVLHVSLKFSTCEIVTLKDDRCSRFIIHASIFITNFQNFKLCLF